MGDFFATYFSPKGPSSGNTGITWSYVNRKNP